MEMQGVLPNMRTARYSRMRRIENKATGEIIEATKTASDTNGAYLEGVVIAPPGFDGIPSHRHQKQDEVFTVIQGKLGTEVNGTTHIFEVGETATILANTTHRWWNAGDEEVRFQAVITPALHFMEIIGCIYRSANERGSDTPSLVDAAITLSHYRDEYNPVFLPLPVRLFGLPLLAFIGKLNGRKQVIDGWITEHYQ